MRERNSAWRKEKWKRNVCYVVNKIHLFSLIHPRQFHPKHSNEAELETKKNEKIKSEQKDSKVYKIISIVFFLEASFFGIEIQVEKSFVVVN